jgi:hypothetical protein
LEEEKDELSESVVELEMLVKRREDDIAEMEI